MNNIFTITLLLLLARGENVDDDTKLSGEGTDEVRHIPSFVSPLSPSVPPVSQPLLTVSVGLRTMAVIGAHSMPTMGGLLTDCHMADCVVSGWPPDMINDNCHMSGTLCCAANKLRVQLAVRVALTVHVTAA